MGRHTTGEIFCSCSSCGHGNSLQCQDYKCNCCTGGGGQYKVTYLKDSGPPAFNW